MVPNIVNEDFENIKNDPNTSELVGTTLEKYIEIFHKTCQEKIHVFLNISPLGNNLREYSRKYTTLITHSTLVYFDDWPQEALIEVSRQFLTDKVLVLDDQKEEEVKQKLCFDISDILSQIHTSVIKILPKFEKETKRKGYFTSSNFIKLIQTFIKVINSKQKTYINNIEKYKQGLVY